ACLAASLANVDAARAGLGSITYDWVTPSAGLSNGTDMFHFVGSITVDSTGTSATPIDLTTGMIQSWQISLLDSTNTVVFSLTSLTDFVEMTGRFISGPFELQAPQITSTSIYIPELPPLAVNLVIDASIFQINSNAASGFPEVNWESELTGNSFFTGVTVTLS